MSVFRLIVRWHGIVCGALALVSLAGSDFARPAESFSFDQTLMLDARPMPPAKHVPILTVAQNGEATIGLWCKTVRGHVELSNGTIRIEPDPLPDDLPQYMVDGQCTDERMKAEEDTLAALAQVIGWRRQGGAIILLGATQQ